MASPAPLAAAAVGLLVFAVFALPGRLAEAADEPVTFAVIGDLPYNAEQAARLDAVVQPALQAAAYPFLIHFGDFQAGDAPCGRSEHKGKSPPQGATWQSLARDRIIGLHAGAVFYTPGDNDWTDCDRFVNGAPQSELASLDSLRRLFFAAAPKLPEDWGFQRQSQFPENAVWRRGDVLFATLHLVGGNNGRLEILMDDVALALSLVAARDEANRVWLRHVFELAGHWAKPAKAVVIASHADPTQGEESAACTPRNPMNCDGYAGFRAQLIKRAGSFGKPVLLLHGDSGPYCLDREFGGAAAPSLWRFNAAGDFNVIDATQVTVTPDRPETPFSFRTVAGAETVPALCD